jgi:hypothetical protein
MGLAIRTAVECTSYKCKKMIIIIVKDDDDDDDEDSEGS